jgi:hypothetical protein
VLIENDVRSLKDKITTRMMDVKMGMESFLRRDGISDR